MALKRGIFFETLLPRPRNDYMETRNETQLLSYENQRVFFGFGGVVMDVFGSPTQTRPQSPQSLPDASLKPCEQAIWRLQRVRI